MKKVVTRFAPSPTGYLHVGGARTAIFNYLMARHAGGEFLLRIEDTDRERSTPEAKQAILDGLDWLGLDHDSLTYQSERQDRHDKAVDKLLDTGQAYYCECTREELDTMRAEAMARGDKPKYDGRCRDKKLGPGPGRVVRLRAPQEGETAFDDMVKGVISVQNSELDDLILRRTDGTPTYNLAVVVDDLEMGVTHVLRGDDHVNNTPRQILIYRALGEPVPVFGHVPMILGPDKKKLSKRHGALSVTAYREMGFLPEAMANYLLRLGFSHGDKEIFSRQEMIDLFEVKNLGSSAAVFDMDKLKWLNANYMRESDPARLAELLPPHLEPLGVTGADAGYLAKIVPLLTPRSQTLVEMAEQALFFLVDDQELAYDDTSVAKFLTPEAREHIAEIAARLADLHEFSQEAIENALRGYIEEAGVKFKVVAQPIRVALTGTTKSPGLFEIIEVLGRERALARLKRAISL